MPDFPDTELTSDSVRFTHRIDCFYECFEFGDVIAELGKMINDRLVASHRPAVIFPIIGSECSYGTLSTINYNSSPTRNPLRDMEKILTSCFRTLLNLLQSNGANRYLKGRKAAISLLQDLNLVFTEDWYMSGYSHDPFYNYLDLDYDPNDQLKVTHRLQHQIANYRAFLDNIPFLYESQSVTFFFPKIEGWKKAILAMQKALTIISGDRITSSPKYKSISVVPMLDRTKTYDVYNWTGPFSYLGEIDPSSYNEDESKIRIDGSYNSWPPVWVPQSTSPYFNKIGVAMGFLTAFQSSFEVAEDGSVWAPNSTVFGVTARWFKFKPAKDLYYRMGITSEFNYVGLEVDVEIPNIGWEFSFEPLYTNTEKTRIKYTTDISSGHLNATSLRQLLGEELLISSTIDDSSIPNGSSPLQYMGGIGQDKPTNFPEWGITTGTPLLEQATLKTYNSSYVFYTESPSNVYLVFP